MYGVSPNLDLSFCLGAPIEQIVVGKYDVQFDFGSGARIAVQGSVEIHRSRSLIASWGQDSGWTSVSFQDVLNISVESIDIPNDRRIDFHFGGDLVLSLIDNSEQFESMQIFSPGAGTPMIVV